MKHIPFLYEVFEKISNAAMTYIMLGVIAASGLMGSQLFAQSVDESLMRVSSRGVELVTDDGVPLTGIIFEHPDAEDAELLPVVVLVNIWALPTSTYFIQAERMAKAGFIVLCFNARGFGSSGGYINVAGPRDIADARLWLDWLEMQPHVAKDRIGMAGVSYGAGIALLTAAHDTRVKAVVSMSGWADLFEALNQNQTPPQAWLDVLFVSAGLLGKMDHYIRDLFADLRHFKLSQAFIKEFTAPRSATNFTQLFNEHNTAVYIQQGLEDELFRPNQMIDFYEKLTTPKRFDFFRGIHASAEVLGMVGVKGSPWDHSLQWFAYWLQGKNVPLMKSPLITMPVYDERKTLAFEDFSPTRRSTAALTLSGESNRWEGTLNDGAAERDFAQSKRIWFSKTTGVGCGIPILSPALEVYLKLPIATNKLLINRGAVAWFEASEFDNDGILVGRPRLQLWVKPTSSRVQLISYLYKMNRYGQATLLSHVPFTRINATPHEPIQVDVDFNFNAVALKAGERLVLAINAHDWLYASPSDSPYAVDILFGGDYNAKLDLTVL